MAQAVVRRRDEDEAELDPTTQTGPTAGERLEQTEADPAGGVAGGAAGGGDPRVSAVQVEAGTLTPEQQAFDAEVARLVQPHLQQQTLAAAAIQHYLHQHSKPSLP